jgi:hypothetical protein
MESGNAVLIIHEDTPSTLDEVLEEVSQKRKNSL